MKPTYTNSVQYNNGRKRESLSYYCRLSMGLSLNTLGRSLSQSRDTLMAGRGHSPMISSRFLLSKARLSITPRKDTRKRQLHYNIAPTRVTCFIRRIHHSILLILQNKIIIFMTYWRGRGAGSSWSARLSCSCAHLPHCWSLGGGAVQTGLSLWCGPAAGSWRLSAESASVERISKESNENVNSN